MGHELRARGLGATLQLAALFPALQTGTHRTKALLHYTLQTPAVRASMSPAAPDSSTAVAGFKTDLLTPLLGTPEPAATPVPPLATAFKSSSPCLLVMGACATLIVIAGYAFGGDSLIGREATPNIPASILLSKPPAYNVAEWTWPRWPWSSPSPPPPTRMVGGGPDESEWNSTRDTLIEYLEAVTFFPGEEARDGFPDIGKGALAITDPATLKQMNGVPGRWLRG